MRFSLENSPAYLSRYLLLASLILFISLFFPNGSQFRYQYQLGQRWSYEGLKAPFDFPILKTEEELAKERERLQTLSLAYYRLDQEQDSIQIEAFEARFAAAWPQQNGSELDSLRYVQVGRQSLAWLYQQRIIHWDSSHLRLMGEGEDLVFSLLNKHNQELGEFSAKEVWTTSQAAQYLLDTLSEVLTQKRLRPNVLLPLVQNSIKPNVYYDAFITNKQREQALASLSLHRGLVHAGSWIVRTDALIDTATYIRLESFRHKFEQEISTSKNRFFVYLGYLLLSIALFLIYVAFVQFYAPEVFDRLRHFSLLLVLIGGYVFLSYEVQQIPGLDLYLIPFCIVPIVVQNFFSAHLALFTHIVIVLLSSMILSLDYQFILIQMIVGMVAILSKLKTRYLSHFFASLMAIALAYTAIFISLELIHTGAFFTVLDEEGVVLTQGVRWPILIWIGFNIGLTLLSYPLIPLFERIFGLTSEITLVEWSDLNNPLLRELSLKAPGTLQHSLQVANLAEAAALAIGANALLVKVAALYHDVGKTVSPEFFVENQTQAETPHKHLTCLESADLIIGHVIEGEKLAKRYRLPSVLTAFIRSHHGTTRVEYFYRTHCKNHPEAMEEDDSSFRYPGPKPANREEALLMLADSLEAAARSLKSPTGLDIDCLVEQIVQAKITAGQFEETNLSFSELQVAKGVFKKMLRSIHHVRLEYPPEGGAKVAVG